MAAMSVRGPPQEEQVVMSIWNTRLSNCAQLRRARVGREPAMEANEMAPLAVEPSQEHAFLTAFLSCWGEAGLPKESKPRKR